MGARGPKPAGDNVRELRGDRPSRKAPPRKPPVTGDVPACPSYLARHAKGAWKRLAPELHASGWLRPQTLDLLVAYCEAAAINQEAARHLHQAGQDPDILVKNRDDRGPVKNPVLQVFRDSADTMLKISRDWDRGVPAAASDDAKARFLS